MRALLVLLSLLVASPTFAWDFDYVKKKAAISGGSGSCSTVWDNGASQTTEAAGVGTATNNTHYATLGADNTSYSRGTRVTVPGGGKNLCKAIWWITNATGDPSSRTVTMKVYALSGNNATGSPLAVSNAVAAVDNTTNAPMEFTFSPAASLPAGTLIFLLVPNGVDASNTINPRIGEITTTRRVWTHDNSDPPAYTGNSINAEMVHEFYE